MSISRIMWMCVLYIYICIGINCCCWAYQVEQKFEAMSNKTRIICLCRCCSLPWLGQPVHSMGLAGAGMWRRLCLEGSLGWDTSPPAKSIVCRPSFSILLSVRGGSLVILTAVMMPPMAAGRWWWYLFLYSFLQVFPTHEQKCLKPHTDLQSKMIHQILPGLGVSHTGASDAVILHAGVLLQSLAGLVLSALSISAAKFTVSSALGEGTEQLLGGRSMDHASQSCLFSMGSSVNRNWNL